MQKLLGPVAVAALLSVPAYAFDYENKIETVQNADKPPVEIVQDTVAFRPIGEQEAGQEARHKEASVSRKVEKKPSKPRASHHLRSGPSLTSVQSRPDAKSSGSLDANAGQQPLAYNSGNAFPNPFSGLAKIFGSGDK